MASLGNLYIKIGADVSEINRNIKSVQANLQGFSNSLQSIARGISFAAIGAAAAEIGKKAIVAAADYETAFFRIQNLTDTTADDIKRFKDSLPDISKEVGKPILELTNSLYGITSAGLQGSEALDTLRIAAKASAIGMGDVDTIAKTLGATINAYGKANISAEQAARILFNTTKLGALDIKELAPSMGNIIPIAATMGVSLSKVGATIAAMSLQGINASESVTSMVSIMNAMLKPSEQAEKLLAGVGLSMEQVRNVARDDFSKAIELVTTAFKGNTSAIAEVLGRVEGLKGFLAISGQNAERYAGILRSVEADTSSFGKASETVLNTTTRKWEAFTSGLQNSVLKAGNILLATSGTVTNSFEKINVAVDQALTGIATVIAKLITDFATIIGYANKLLETLVKIDNTLLGGGLQKLQSLIQQFFGIEKVQEVTIKTNVQDPRDNFESGFGQREFKAPVVKKPFKSPIVDKSASDKVRREVEAAYDSLEQLNRQVEDANKEFEEWQVTIGTLPLSSFEEKVYSGTVGLKLLSTEIQDDPVLFDAWSKSVGNMGTELSNLAPKFEPIQDKLTEMEQAAVDFGEAITQALQQGVSNSLISVGEQIGSALGGGVFNFTSLLAPLLDMLIYIGKLAIETGVALSGIKIALKTLNPAAAIIGGVALIALASFVKSQITKAPKLAKGGLAYKPTFAVVGDNPGANTDPEVIAPLSKIVGILRSQMVQVAKSLSSSFVSAIREFQPQASAIQLPSISSLSQSLTRPLLQPLSDIDIMPVPVTVSGDLKLAGRDLISAVQLNQSISNRQYGSKY
jgi:TP901 family phage tail tape measure protein